MYKLFLSLFCTLLLSITFCQSFSVDQLQVNIEGDASNESIANNTFLNANSSASLQWTIVDASIPQEWEFSNCFPNCYNVGVTSGSLEIIEGESYYLNCHVYPNNTLGEGSITMQITSNDGTTELVTWQAVAGSAGMNEINWSIERELVKIVNLLGQEVEYQPCTTLIYQYSDGTSERVFTIED